MNDTTKIAPPMVLNADGETYRYPGTLQYPMDVDGQKRAGLIASTNFSIHPKKQAAQTKGKARRHDGEGERA